MPNASSQQELSLHTFFFFILPGQNGLRGEPTTFPNSAKTSQTFKRDAVQGRLYQKGAGTPGPPLPQR